MSKKTKKLINILFNFIKIFRARGNHAIFRALFVTLKSFVRLVATVANHEHIVWSACDSTSISQSIFMLSTLHLSSSFSLPCLSTITNKEGNFFEMSFSKLLLTFSTGSYTRFGETNQIAAQRVAIKLDLRFLTSGQCYAIT